MKVVAIYPHSERPVLELPLASSSVSAGFASPALDYEENPLNLGGYLVKHPASTYVVRARGDSMEEVGIMDGALLVVDRSLELRDGRIVIAGIDGDLTVKKFRVENGCAKLVAGNKRYQPIIVTDENVVWGIVVHAINSYP